MLSRRLGLAVFAVLLIGGCAAVPLSESELALNQRLIAGIDNCVAGNQAVVEQVGKQLSLIEQQNSQLSALKDAQLESDSSKLVRQNSDCVALGEDFVSDQLQDKQLVGQLEEIWMPNLNLALNARIDTGAETASLDARNIELFERNGKRWVRFEIEHPQENEQPLQLERKLSRIVSIVQSNSPEPEKRPVIKLGITIGSVNQTAEFTLSNRSHLDYQVLIGRNILQDVMVVDVSQKNIAPHIQTETDVANVGAR